MDQDNSWSFNTNGTTSSDCVPIYLQIFLRVLRGNICRPNGTRHVNLRNVCFFFRVWHQVLGTSAQTVRMWICTTRFFGGKFRVLHYLFPNSVRATSNFSLQIFYLGFTRRFFSSTNSTSVPSFSEGRFYCFVSSSEDDSRSGNFFEFRVGLF